MPKKPQVENDFTIPGPTRTTPRVSPAKQNQILSNVNALIQGVIRLTLFAATSKCDCLACHQLRRLAPHVNKVLELGEQGVKTKTV